MLRILIIEILLTGIIGAVLFRLAWALTKKKTVSWASVLVLAAVIMLFVPGHIDETLIVEYGGRLPAEHDFAPVIVNLLRSLGLLAGAWLASLAIARRKQMGLEDKPPFDDFP